MPIFCNPNGLVSILKIHILNKYLNLTFIILLTIILIIVMWVGKVEYNTYPYFRKNPLRKTLIIFIKNLLNRGN